MIRRPPGASARESQERYRRLVEGARDYALHALDGEGRVSGWNPGAQRMFGWNEADVLGRDFAMSFTDEDRAFIARCPMFFVATADSAGRPDCSYKGGMPGFVRTLDDTTLAFPDYDGNGMYRSWGNVQANPHVALLFIDFDTPKRLRVNGTAQVSASDPLMASFHGAAFVVRVRAQAIFPNCPRYIPTFEFVEPSVYAPRAGQDPVEPAWKGFDIFADVVPPRQQTFRG